MSEKEDTPVIDFIAHVVVAAFLAAVQLFVACFIGTRSAEAAFREWLILIRTWWGASFIAASGIVGGGVLWWIDRRRKQKRSLKTKERGSG